MSRSSWKMIAFALVVLIAIMTLLWCVQEGYIPWLHSLHSKTEFGEYAAVWSDKEKVVHYGFYVDHGVAEAETVCGQKYTNGRADPLRHGTIMEAREAGCSVCEKCDSKIVLVEADLAH